MNTYPAISHRFQSVRAPDLQGYWLDAKDWLRACRQALVRRRTEKLLAGLDRAILEDLGVPHDGVSPSAGALDRYPYVITVEVRKV